MMPIPVSRTPRQMLFRHFDAAASNIVLQGDPANQDNYIITQQTGTVWCVRCAIYSIMLNGVKVTRSSSGAYCLYTIFGGQLNIQNVTLEGTGAASANGQYHTYTLTGGSLAITGPIKIIGNASVPFLVQSFGTLGVAGGTQTVSISGAPMWSVGFVNCAQGRAEIGALAFSGSASGQRYSVIENGVVNVEGQGASFLPGSAVGASSSGGQYV